MKIQLSEKSIYFNWPEKDTGWRTFLTNKYLKDKEIFFVEYDPEYPVKYAIFITEEEWVAFVDQRRDENFKKVSATNRERASNPTYAYKKGRLGYARLEEKIVSIQKCYDLINCLNVL